MSKLHHRKFARFFPAYHPKAGQPTYFVEKIWESMIQTEHISLSKCVQLSRETGIGDLDMYKVRKIDFDPKYHTIRAGRSVKVGDFIRPSVWSGKPYASPQIIIGPDIEVKKTWDFEMDILGVCSIGDPGEQLEYTFVRRMIEDNILDENSLDNTIARNDGLTPEDFYFWFSRSPEFKKNEGFEGQILCWSDNVEY